MKVINASAKLIEYNVINLNLKERSVLFGDNPQDNMANVLTFVFTVIAGIVFYYTTWVVGLIALVIGVFVAIKLASWLVDDSRPGVHFDRVAEVKVTQFDRLSMMDSSTGSSLGGAAVGGLLFGGVGAIVGSVAGGNSKSSDIVEKANIQITFAGGSWVVVEKDRIKDPLFVAFVKDIGDRYICS